MTPQELTDWLRLNLTEGIGNDAAQRLLTRFGSPTAVFAQPASTLCCVVSHVQANALLKTPLTLDMQVSHTQHWLAQSTPECERALWTLGDTHYPAAFLQLPDPPLMVYAQGQLSWSLPDAVAVVGSRNPTPQGAQTAEQFCTALAQAGLCVVSGLALGVDGAAHRGALKATSHALPRILTIAVVGTGLDRVYPRQHHALAQDIARQGWLLSEYPLGTPPLPHHFPKRNRLIAALGLGTLVVEAALQSGSLITAHEALDLGREVLAIPGSIHAPQSRGCHALIKEGATLVETAQDVLNELRPTHGDLYAHTGLSTHKPLLTRDTHDTPEHTDPADPTRSPTLSNDAPSPPPHPLLAHLGHVPVSLEALQTRCTWDTATLLGALLALELDGHVARLPGGLFQRLGASSSTY